MIYVMIGAMGLVVFLNRYLFIEPRLPVRLNRGAREFLGFAVPGMLTAICETCQTIMHKAINRVDLEAVRAKLDVTIQTADPRLVSRERAPSNVILETGAQTHAKAQC